MLYSHISGHFGNILDYVNSSTIAVHSGIETTLAVAEANKRLNRVSDVGAYTLSPYGFWVTNSRIRVWVMS